MKPLTQAEVDLLNEQELDEYLSLTDHWQSQNDTEFHLYTPNPVPALFHASTAKCRALFGGNRSGKTYAATTDAAAQFLGEAPKDLEGIIPKYRLDKRRKNRLCMFDYPNSFVKTNWPAIEKLIPANRVETTIREQGKIKALINDKGGLLEFMYYEQKVTKLQGADRDSIFYDEEPPEDQRKENLMRLADRDGEEVFSLTPVTGATQWMYDKIYLKASKVSDILNGQLVRKDNPEGNPNIEVFFANIYDNKSISKKGADRVLSEYPIEERMMREGGKFMFLSGLVYKDYNDLTHLLDPESPINDAWWQKKTKYDYTPYVLIDPHPRTPHAVLFCMVRRDGMMYVVDELFEDCVPKELAWMIKDRLRGRQPEAVIIDPLGWTPSAARDGCFTDDLIDAFGAPDVDVRTHIVKSSKDLTNGILEVKTALKPNDEGIPAIMISPRCHRFRFEITHWAWDDYTKATQTSRGEKQKPRDKDDHMMENLYRFIVFRPRWIPREEDQIDFYEDEHNNTQSRVARGASKVTGY